MRPLLILCLTALLTGCALPMARPAPDGGEIKIHYAQTVYFLTADRDNLDEFWLMFKDSKYWVRASHSPRGGCWHFVDTHTALRIVAIWKRSAPLLEKIQNQPQTGLDITTYSFKGYNEADVEGKTPPYDFEKIQEMIMKAWNYCRKPSRTSQRGMETSLRALEQ